MAENIQIAVIGGSGLYNMPQIKDKTKIKVETPFGAPSSDIVIGTINDKRVAFIARHGEGHIYPPNKVPYKANIYALKTLGVRYIISVNACGSLKEAYAPGHIVIPDQLFDYTLGNRERSFFDQEGIVAHISVAEPFCHELRNLLIDAVQSVGGTAHPTGTLLIEDGPRFATRAESLIFKSWGCDVIGMTAIPEAFLAREAEIAYASMAHITDYDSWHEEEEAVTAEMVMKTVQSNLKTVQEAIAIAINGLSQAECSCHKVLDNAITTSRSHIPEAAIEQLKPIVARSLKIDVK